MNLEPQWIVGFVDGEGCFHVSVNKHPEMTIGYQVLPEFVVVQHERDEQVLNGLKKYFGCGVVRSNHGDRLCYRVREKKNLSDVIIPFFMKHQLKTRKRQEFESFRKIIHLMNNNQHLTVEGLESIRKISKGMNRGRLR